MLKNIFLVELSSIRLIDKNEFTFTGRKRYITARSNKDVFIDIYTGEEYNKKTVTGDEIVTSVILLYDDMTFNSRLRLIK